MDAATPRRLDQPNAQAPVDDELLFDVPAYAREALGPQRETLASSASAPPQQVVSALHYLARRAKDTPSWLAHVLVTQTHKDPRATAFLNAWAYEQYWLGDSLAALAGAETPGSTHTLHGSGLRARLRQFGPLAAAITANLHGRALLGVQMAERLVDSWLTDALLARCAELTPEISGELAQVRGTLKRQQEFFAEVATGELRHSGRVRRLAVRRLKRHAWPLGAEREGAAATTTLFHSLFGSQRNWAQHLNARVATLPGFGRVRLF